MHTAEYPAPDRTLLHLSDTHLRAPGARLFDVIDGAERMQRTLASIVDSGVRPDALIFTGDLADLGEPDWVPLRMLAKPTVRAAVAGYMRISRVGLVTPLRDGMNLVAKEYVAAQNPEDPGVLILSRFAGAACQLTDAVLINPYSAEEMSDAIMLALRMPREERIERWQRMMDVITREDIGWWRKTFTEALMEAPLEMEQEPA